MGKGLGECLALNDRLAAANGEARSLTEELGLAAATALAAVAKGAAGLGEGAMALRGAADEALLHNAEAAGTASRVGSLSKETAQVGPGARARRRPVGWPSQQARRRRGRLVRSDSQPAWARPCIVGRWVGSAASRLSSICWQPCIRLPPTRPPSSDLYQSNDLTSKLEDQACS